MYTHIEYMARNLTMCSIMAEFRSRLQILCERILSVNYIYEMNKMLWREVDTRVVQRHKEIKNIEYSKAAIAFFKSLISRK